MDSCLSWLHLSDLHFLDKHAWRDNRVLGDLIKDIQDRLTAGVQIDLVFCTGDIGFGETSKEPMSEQYEDALVFFDQVLNACGLSRDRLFIVPGNHDIDRKKVLKSQTEWFRSEKRLLHEINQEFSDGSLEVINAMARLSAYSDFVNENLPHLKLNKSSFFGKVLEVNGIKLAITGLNSAWTCVDKDDQLRLWLAGATQLHATREAIKTELAGSDPGLRIGLIHHPYTWLNSEEAKDMQGKFEKDFDFLLHGHSHHQWVVENPTPHHVMVAAGASTAETTAEFGYNIVEFSPTGTNVHLRTYSNKGGGGWIAENIPQRAPNGTWPLSAPFAVTPNRNDKETTPPRLLIVPAGRQDSATEIASEVGTPASRGYFGLDTFLKESSKHLSKQRLLAIYGIAGVGKSTLVKELQKQSEWAKYQYISITVGEEGRLADLYSQIAPHLGCHDERPRPPSGVSPAQISDALRSRFPDSPILFIHVERAHNWFSHGSWNDVNIPHFLKGLVQAYPQIAIILETREQPELTIKSMEITGLREDAVAEYLTHPPGQEMGWTLNRERRNYVFQRLGGGYGRGAHAYGLELLVRLAGSKGVAPDAVLKDFRDYFAQELYEKLFRSLYEHFLSDGERLLLFSCSLYREGLPYRHLQLLEEALSVPQAGNSLLRRRLITENREWIYLHDLVADQAFRLGEGGANVEALHRTIAGFWLEELKGQFLLLEPNIRRALEALHHLEKGGEGERVSEITPNLFGRRSDEAVAILWRLEKQFAMLPEDTKICTVLEYLLHIDPNDHMAMRFLGESRRRLYGPKDQKALELFRSATTVRSDFAPYWANYGHSAIALGDPKVLDIFLADVKDAPEGAWDEQLTTIVANALEAADRGAEAKRLREENINSGSRNAAIYVDHAKWLLEKEQDAQNAIRILELAGQRGCGNEITANALMRIKESLAC